MAHVLHKLLQSQRIKGWGREEKVMGLGLINISGRMIWVLCRTRFHKLQFENVAYSCRSDGDDSVKVGGRCAFRRLNKLCQRFISLLITKLIS